MGYTFGAMPWNQVTLMEEKHRFVSLAATGRFTFTELCADFHVSRKTGHKWLGRYRKVGAAGLHERSRRPHGCAHQTAVRIERLILRERRQHRTWGPKKLRRLLHRDHGIRRLPACSTIAAILRRRGLSQRPRRKPGLYRKTCRTRLSSRLIAGLFSIAEARRGPNLQ